MLISIIISVYNLEDYIGECINSLVNQDFNDYEIILVDDGSNDKSAEICNRFSEFSHIKYFFKNNGGASSARNFGLAKAKGEYVIFMDGDDYWDDYSALKILSEKIKFKPDFILYGCKDLDSVTGHIAFSRGNYDLEIFENGDKSNIVNYLTKKNIFPGAAWLVCVKKEMLLEKQITFQEGIKAEDLDWLINIFYNAGKIVAVNQNFYIYRKRRAGSVTFKFDTKSMDGILYTLGKWKPLLLENNNLKKLLSFLNFHYILLIIMPEKINDEYLKKINEHKDLLKYSLGFRNKLVSYFIFIFGIKMSNFFFHLLYKK